MLNVKQLPRTPSELAKARQEAASISFALREAHRSAANLGSLAQRVSAADKDSDKKQLAGGKSGDGRARLDPSTDFGATIETKKSLTSSRVLFGEKKHSFLLFDSKTEFQTSEVDEDSEDADSTASSIGKVTQQHHIVEETEDRFGYRDLVFYLFDGFSTAELAGMFPNWYEASLWAERINFFFVIASIIAIATETLPQFYNENISAFFIIEVVCIAYFTVDFLARLFCTPHLGKFLKSPLNWVDFVSILPFYVGQVLSAVNGGGVMTLRYFRLLRILRVLKLSRRNVGLLAVWEALRESSEAFSLLAFLMILALLMFSSLVFYAEQYGGYFDANTNLWYRSDGKASPFQSIFHCMWWCIVTMSTVGYGDDVPITVFGKLVGGATMICGVFVLAFPTVILSTNFQEIHQSKVDGHLQMQQIYASQREAARLRADERRKRRESEQQLEQEMLEEAGDGGEVDGQQRQDDESKLVNGTTGSPPAFPPTRSPSVQHLDVVSAPVLPTNFTFHYDPYAQHRSTVSAGSPLKIPSLALRTIGSLLQPKEDNGASATHPREVVIIADTIAMYNPVLHFVTRHGGLRVRVEPCLTKTIVSLKLALESQECQEAAEIAVKQNRPDLFGKLMVLPRPIHKLKLDVACDHPLLHDVRLQCTTFIDPAGTIPLSLVVPYPSLVSVLLANLSSLSVMMWIAYDRASAVDEPLYHYGGAILAGTDFDEEEMDVHSRKLIADPVTRADGAAFMGTAANRTNSPVAATAARPMAATPEFGTFSTASHQLFDGGIGPRSTDASAPKDDEPAPADAARKKSGGARRLSLEGIKGRGEVRSPAMHSPLVGTPKRE